MTADTLTWHDDFLLGHSAIDTYHEAFVGHVRALQEADDASWPALYDELLKHLEEHFGSEDKLMLDTEFPPRQCHMDEHASVLSSVREVRERLAEGRLDIARDLLAHLVEWFPKHTQHLDSALAHWANKSRLGGKAVVIKRGLNLR